MKKVKRFVLFTGAQYECSLGLSGYETSFDTLNEAKDFVLEVLNNHDDETCMEEWEVDDMETAKTLYESGPRWDYGDEDFILFMGKRRCNRLHL